MADTRLLSEDQLSLLTAILDKQNKNICAVAKSLQNNLVAGAYAGDIFHDIIEDQIELSRVMDIECDAIEALKLPQSLGFQKKVNRT